MDECELCHENENLCESRYFLVNCVNFCVDRYKPMALIYVHSQILKNKTKGKKNLRKKIDAAEESSGNEKPVYFHPHRGHFIHFFWVKSSNHSRNRKKCVQIVR